MKKTILCSLLFLAGLALQAQQKITPHFPEGVPECDRLLALKDSLLIARTNGQFLENITEQEDIELSQLYSWVDYQWLNCISGKEVKFCNFPTTTQPQDLWLPCPETETGIGIHFNERFYNETEWRWVSLPSSFEGWMAWRMEQALTKLRN